MLFLQGTRDAFAEVGLIERARARLGTGASLHWVKGADRSFNVLKRSGRSAGEVMDELAHAISDWATQALGI